VAIPKESTISCAVAAIGTLLAGCTEIGASSRPPELCDPMPNKLLYGDNLELLRDSKRVRDESIDLCYIDPPFNSKRRYNQIYNNEGYEDLAQAQAFVDIHTWNEHSILCYDEIRTNAGNRYTERLIELIKGLHAVLQEGPLLAYIVCMAARIVEIHRVLKESGSFYLHCDPTSSHYLKLVCDAVFCAQGGDFRNEIVWKRTASHNSAHRYGPVHDVILYYTKSDGATWNKQRQAYGEKYKKKFGKLDDKTGLPFQDQNLTGPGVRSGPSGQAWRGCDPTAKGRHWQPASYLYTRYTALTGDELNKYPLLERLDKLDEIGLIYWSKKKGGLPRYKQFLEDSEGLVLPDVWTDIDVINSQAKERIGYPTQKPIALMERIILASTKEGDTVLDVYCGCGTTIAAAQKSNRWWIGMDITAQAISTIYNRLEEEFPELDLRNIIDGGAPRDVASARRLANKRDDRLRKEFEKWAILTYCNHKAIIHEKKGGDKGIDGITYIVTADGETDKMVLQVKSGGVTRGDIAQLLGDMGEAKLAALITLEAPSRGMIEKANSAGTYTNTLTGKKCPKIRIVTIEEMLGKTRTRLELPQSLEAWKTALREAESQQMKLDLTPEKRPAASVLEMQPAKTSKK
jgi:DNA modification methylase